MMTLRLRNRTLKLRALCWVLRRMRAGQRGWRCRSERAHSAARRGHIGHILYRRSVLSANLMKTIDIHMGHDPIYALHWRPELWRRCAY